MPRRGDAEDEASNWESLPRKASKQQDVQRRAFVELPVRAHAHCAEAGEAWVAPGLHSQPWMAARVAVEGVEVLDDLAEPQGRQQIHEQDVQGQERGGVRKRKAESVLRPLERVCRVRPNLAMSPGGTQSNDVRRQAAKRQLAIAAQQLLQDPERQLPQLKALLELLHDEDGQVCRLAMLTLLAVFKDLLPAYRIRPVVDKEEGAGKLSKDVRALKLYEETLLDSYHKYLQALKQTLKRSTAGQAPMQHGRVAIKCMAGLLLAAPHFNYRSDLLQALVTCLPHKDSQVRDAAQDGLSDLLAGSFGDGEVATEVVQLLADLVRHLECVGPPALLDCLLSLRFPDVVVPISSSDASRSKKKLKKAQDGVDRSFLEAQAAVATAERRANQTATVEALFELLFRVLKTCTASSVIQQQEGSPLSRAQFMKKFPLLFPALRLLSKNVHLLGMEYIQGVMRELRLLLCSSALPPEERLRVLLTAAELVQGEGEMLSAEHSNFYVETYAALVHSMLVPLLEIRSDLPLRMSSPSDQEDAVFTSMITSTNASMKAGEQMCFLVPSIVQALVLDAKALDPPRQAAFAKRMLAVVAGAGDSGLAMGMLCLLQRMLRRSRRLQAMLQHESGGSTLHAYIPDAVDPAEACALAAPFWELTLLARHYHPHVAAVSEQLAAGNPVSMLPLYGAVAAFSTAYSTCTGGFRPDVGRKEA